MRRSFLPLVCLTLAAVLLVPMLSMRIARASQDVDLALVLLTDVSRSVDDSEFKQMRFGFFENNKDLQQGCRVVQGLQSGNEVSGDACFSKQRN